MNKRLCLLACAVAGLALVLVCFWATRPNLPRYEGKRVAEWFAQADGSQLSIYDGAPAGPGGSPNPAFMAFLELRGDAVPYLSGVAIRRQGLLARSYYVGWSKLPARWQKLFPAGYSEAEWTMQREHALRLIGAIAYWENRPRSWGHTGAPMPRALVVATFRQCLRDTDPQVTSCAASSAGCLGMAAEPLVPDLVALLSGSHRRAQSAAINTLGVIGAAEAVHPLSVFLREPHGVLTREAVRALGRIGSPSSPAAPAIARLLGERRDSANYIARALYQIGTTPLEAVPALERVLTQESNTVQTRQLAALALWNVDREDPARIASVSNLISELPLTGLHFFADLKTVPSCTNLASVIARLADSEMPEVRRVALLVLQRVQEAAQ
jgi:hypothetical protein